MRGLLVVIAVIEFGDAAPSDRLTELAKTARLLRNLDCKQHLPFFADCGSLCNMAQTIKVDVGATIYDDKCFVLECMLAYVFFRASDCKRTRRFDDRARVFKYVTNSGADLVGIDSHYFIHELLADTEGFVSNTPHCDAISKDANMIQSDELAGIERCLHCCRIRRFYTDDFDVRPGALNICSNPGDQSTAADRHKDGRNVIFHLCNQLPTDRSLASDDSWIIKRMNECELHLLRQLQRFYVGVVVGVTEKHDLTAKRLHGVDLYGRCSNRHYDDCSCVFSLGGQCYALGMVTGRAANYACLQRIIR